MFSLLRNIFLLSAATTFLVADNAFAFGVHHPHSQQQQQQQQQQQRNSVLRATPTNTDTDDLLKPSYDIEPLTVRIGHGFDIHRMAPLEEAGQPVVIGGVTVTHKDQKVSDEDCWENGDCLWEGFDLSVVVKIWIVLVDLELSIFLEKTGTVSNEYFVLCQ
jgi:hypothetical protein